MSFRITSLWAWTMVDEMDEEGIIAFLAPGGMWMPLIASDRVRLDQLREKAEITARTMGRPAILRRFGDGEELDRIVP